MYFKIIIFFGCKTVILYVNAKGDGSHYTAKQKKNEFTKSTYIYIRLTLCPRKDNRGISDIPPRHPRFTKNYLAMKTTADVTGGKPIAV
jgi:hypothetical protein